MSFYLDTSCLLKLLLIEPGSRDVRDFVATADDVLVSSLTRLEAEVTLEGGHRGGRLRAGQWKAFREKLGSLLDLAPFRACPLPGSLFETALAQQHRPGSVHCRSLDRLHLAAMEELRTTHLVTHDAAQATAARALGYRVDEPGRRSSARGGAGRSAARQPRPRKVPSR